MKVKISSIFCIYLLSLPFTQALTLNIGFPLKLCELLLFCLLFLYLYIGKASKTLIHLLVKYKAVTFLLIWVLLSFLINAYWHYNYPPKTLPFRISAAGDSFLRLCYIVLNIVAFFISVILLIKHPKHILNLWITGALLAAVYAWYLFISSGLNLPYIKLFGMEDAPQNLRGFIRCGTFKEGNFFGLYLILSAVIAFYLNKIKSGVFLLITIVTTFSTISVVSAIVLILFVVRKQFLKKKVLIVFFIALPFVIGSVVYLVKTPYFQKFIYAKITEPSNVLTTSNFSKVDRTLTARIGFFQGIDNPFFGVGPYNYGLHYDRYNDFETYITNNNDWSLKFFPRPNRRRIPNNVYIEVFAEYGFICFLFFTIFLIQILVVAFKNKNDFITGGVIAILISFNAFPSFIMLFIWTFFAIPVAINFKNKYKNG